MNLVGMEYRKLLKSPLVLAGMGLLFLMLVILYAGFIVKDVQITGLQFMLAALGNLTNTGIFHLSVIIAASVCFASEFSWGTIRYIRIRPVSIRALYAAKLAACMLFVLTIALLILVVSSFAGILSWGTGYVLDENGGRIADPWLRLGLFYGFTVMNQLFIVMLCLLLSLLTRQHTTTLLTAYSIYVLLLIFVPEGAIPFTPVAAHTAKPFLISREVGYTGMFSATMVTLLYSAVLLLLSVRFAKQPEQTI